MNLSRWRLTGTNACILLFVSAILAPMQGALAATSQSALSAVLHTQNLFLEVYLNGYPTNRILAVKFVQGRVFMSPADLSEIGIKSPPGTVNEDGLVYLLDIPSVYYNLEQYRQIINISIDPQRLPQQQLSFRGDRQYSVPSVNFGSVLNYDVFAMHEIDSGNNDDNGQVSSFMDYRLFGAWGRFSQTGIVRDGNNDENVRLDTYWTYSNLDSLTAYRLGDTVSSGLTWSRPVRMAGFQMQRNFGIRPDLVTYPVPQVSGTAAVPSTLELFVNNVRRHSQDIQAGPYVVNDMPVITGHGEARLVVRDALGREQVTTLPFYASPQLLRTGLLDYSLETGFLRENFGAESNDYSDGIAFLGTARYGLKEQMTLEGHTEISEDLFNFGVGAVNTLGYSGVLATGVAISDFNGDSGAQVSASYHYLAQPFSFFMSTRHASDMYADLATTTGTPTSARVNQLGVSYASRDMGSLGASLIDISQNDMAAITDQPRPGCSGRFSCFEPIRGESRLATVSYSKQLRSRLSLFATVFKDINSEQSGFTIGFSMPLGRDIYTVADLQSVEDENSTTLQAFKSVPVEGRGFGWRVRKSSGNASLGTAAIGYRGENATLEVGANDFDGQSEAFLDLRGAAVALSGDFFLSNTIFDSFAVADVGVPDVTVLHENRPIGQTDKDGRVLVTGLNSYHASQIAIDPLDLPVEYEPTEVSRVAVPMEQSGLLIDLKAVKSHAASVFLYLENGEPVPIGAIVRMHDDLNTHIVGYDGLAFIKPLRKVNHAFVDWGRGSCEAVFEYQETPGSQMKIGPVTCFSMVEQ